MRYSWAVVASAVVATGLGVWFALAVPLGLPYDEPSHWATVQWYASEHRLPVLGEPGVTYEARMGPVYYTVAALVVAAAGGADQPHAPTILPLVGVVLLPILVVLTYRIGRPMSAPLGVSATAAAVVATTPLLVMVGASIQNDFLCFVLIARCLLVGMRLFRRPGASRLGHLGLGVLVGLAVLTKIVALALVPALALAYLAANAPLGRRLAWASAAAIGVVATSGWWFARNLVVYGDPRAHGPWLVWGSPSHAKSGPASVMSWPGSATSCPISTSRWSTTGTSSALWHRCG